MALKPSISLIYIKKCYKNAYLSDLEEYSDTIRFYFNNNTYFPDKYDPLILFISNELNDDNKNNDLNCFTSFEFLINRKIIDPNSIVKGYLLLDKCISNYNNSFLAKKRIDLLLEFTYPDVIKNYRDKLGWPILLNLCNNNRFDNDYFEYLCDKFISFGVDLTTTVNINTNFSFIESVTMKANKKYVKLSLEKNNLSHSDKTKLVMDLLKYYEYIKEEKVINDIIDIIKMFIDSGCDSNYLNTENYNLMDCVIYLGWSNTYLISYLDKNGFKKSNIKIV